MTKKILINATQAEEIRVAIIDNKTLIDLDIEASHKIQKKANIYQARVSRSEPSLNALFVDYGAQRHGFLPMKELAYPYVDRDGKPKLREGDEIVIQIEKEERGTKGAAVTTFITLAGCYVVLMPNSNGGGGVSRRIEGEDRQQLKELLEGLTVPDHMSVIARTACLGRSKEELQWDLDSLLKLWATIQEEAKKNKAPFLIYQESDVIMRSVRDYLRQDIEEIIVDERKTYERVLELVRNLRPDFADRVRFYHNDIGLFTFYRVESQIETAYQREVKLPSGGSIVIDHTEALTSIDINSSRATRGGDIEETAFLTNQEAAREIARQMKLRDLGGLIVIDFIDMENPKNQRQVEDVLMDAVKTDRARIQIGKISRFGLLELSRQRLRPSLEESSGMMCPRCSGQGTIRGVESLSLSIIRLIQEEAMRADTLEVQVQLPIPVVTFILNEKRNMISQIETQNKIRVVLIPNPNLETPHYQLNKVTQTTDEVVPSYMLQAPIQAETYTHTQVKLKEVEQPAIRSLSIEAAPSRGILKRTLGGVISKLQDMLSTSNEEGTPEPQEKNRNFEQRHRQHSGNKRHSHQRGNMRHQRPPRQDKNQDRNNDRRRDDRRREHSPHAPRGPQRSQAAQRGPQQEQNIEKDRPLEVIRRPVVAPPAPSKPVVQEFAIEKPALATTTPKELSPQVRQFLGGGDLNKANQNQVQSRESVSTEAKLKREEVVQTTQVSLDKIRENVKKQHEQSGERVETKASTPSHTNPHLAKDVALIDKKKPE